MKIITDNEWILMKKRFNELKEQIEFLTQEIYIQNYIREMELIKCFEEQLL